MHAKWLRSSKNQVEQGNEKDYKASKGKRMVAIAKASSNVFYGDVVSWGEQTIRDWEGSKPRLEYEIRSLDPHLLSKMN